MKLLKHRTVLLAALLIPTLSSTVLSAPIEVDLVITPSGGNFDYAATIHNNTAIDLTIVSLTDAPPNDSLIDSSLSAPAGYLALYDSNLGVIDFLEDTSTFPANASVGGFTFQSSTPPTSFFDVFTAIDIEGNIFEGLLNVTGRPTATPDGGATALLLALGISLCALAKTNRL